MIAGILHMGSGLGNQLHRIIATKVLALDKGYNWAMLNPENFKGKHLFRNLDLGSTQKTEYWMFKHQFHEKKVVENGVDVRDYDPDIKFVTDNTVLDGEFQDPRYFEHRLDEIREWLKVEPLEIPDNVCIINFRGGEYVGVPELFLPRAYWDTAIAIMREKYPNMKFEIHTDDAYTANKFFSKDLYPDFKIISDMELNWRSIRYAKHLIVSNSSFAIMPALLGDAQEIIAPKYWAGYNKGFWQLKQNQYNRFTYIHHENK